MYMCICVYINIFVLYDIVDRNLNTYVLATEAVRYICKS